MRLDWHFINSPSAHAFKKLVDHPPHIQCITVMGTFKAWHPFNCQFILLVSIRTIKLSSVDTSIDTWVRTWQVPNNTQLKHLASKHPSKAFHDLLPRVTSVEPLRYRPPRDQLEFFLKALTPNICSLTYNPYTHSCPRFLSSSQGIKKIHLMAYYGDGMADEWKWK